MAEVSIIKKPVNSKKFRKSSQILLKYLPKAENAEDKKDGIR